MHFTTVLAASSVVASAFAGAGYYEPSPEPTTTSCSKTVVPEYETTSTPVYEAPETTEVPEYPTASPEEPSCKDIVYTSYSVSENAYDYKVYTHTIYSTSSCPYVAPEPTYVPAYPAKNCTTSAGYEVPEYPATEVPEYPTSTTDVHYSPEETVYTVYTTVCPGKSYCYGTTVTSTYCPQTDKTVVPEPTYPPKTYEHPPKSYEPEHPTYTAPPSYGHNETIPPPPSYTGAASSTTVSFGAIAFAGLVAFFVAA
jgi:hypothetical protein